MKPRIDLSTAIMEIHAIENECALLISAATDSAMRLGNVKDRSQQEAYYQGKKTGLRLAIVACKKALAAIQKPAV